MNRQICCAVFCALALSGTASHVHAAPGDGSRQEQLDEARRQEDEREARRREPSIHLTPGDVQAQPAETAPNGQTFLINEITLRNAADRWNFLTRITKQYEGRELDLSAVNTLLRELNQKLLARGYVTTRITLPEQNLRGGHLVLDLRIGYMGEMKYAEGSPHIPWRNSFPIRKGDVLNLRALEQGVEQMHKVSSQRIDIRLIPSDREGYSDVELTVQRGRNVFGIISVDNSGLDATGKLQAGFTLGIDSPTGARISCVLALTWTAPMTAIGGARAARTSIMPFRSVTIPFLFRIIGAITGRPCTCGRIRSSAAVHRVRPG